MKVSVGDLNAGTEYYYRVSDTFNQVQVGHFRTSTPPDAYSGLSFGVSGDWRGELAPYPAVSNAAGAGLEFFVALGDTIYADYPSPDVPLPQAMTLDECGKRQLYRANQFGLDAATFVLDARSFRDEQLPSVTNPNDPIQVGQFLAASFDPSRTMLGRQQVEDLRADLLAADEAGVTWRSSTTTTSTTWCSWPRISMARWSTT